MFVSINWIKEYVNLDGFDIDKLIGSFTLATAEVEEIIHKGDDVQNVVVGEIVSIENHPDSKKLHLLKVDGGDRLYDVVCGAPNVAMNMKVAFVKAGGRVPAGEITKAKIAGYESEGMCCSAFELGLSDDKSGLMQIRADIPNGTDLKEVYPIDDVIFEVDNKSLTNRPDLWGHYGIAREFAALAGRELKPLNLADLDYDGDYKVPVTIEREDMAFRYSCLKMDNIGVNVSNEVMSTRLYYCGMRPINLLADVTNYIMLEVGQPTHAFDATKITDIVVKTPAEKMNFTTLDGIERVVDEDTLMICNGDTPVAIAGIMGGLDSEIVDGTTSVVLESANFDGACVRKSSSRLGHRTDASARYEKMLDPELTLTAIRRFVQLVKEADPNAVIASQLTDVYPTKYPEITLKIDKTYVDRYTGIDISCDRIYNTLVSLGFKVEMNGEEFTVVVPSWRATKDVTIKADLIEEITRIYGYDNFEIATTRSPLKPVAPSVARSEDNEIKDLLVKKYSLHEVHSYLWTDSKKYKKLGIEVEENVKVLNIETSENGTLRNSMLPTLLSAVYDNRDFADKFGIFEIGRVIKGTKVDGTCDEHRSLGAVLFDKSGDEKKLYFETVAMINTLFAQIKHTKPAFEKTEVAHKWQHPKNTAVIAADGITVGTLCTLHPLNRTKVDKTAAVVCVEIDLDSFNSVKGRSISFVEPSTQQQTYYDLSLVLTPDIKFSQLETAWNSLNLSELNTVKVIDVYEKDDIKSVTVRLIFCAYDRTLGMDEVQSWIDKILANLATLGVTIRS